MSEEKFYAIGYLCKDDLRGLFKENKKALKVINEMDGDEIKYFLRKFLDVLESITFWDDLKVCFEERYLLK